MRCIYDLPWNGSQYGSFPPVLRCQRQEICTAEFDDHDPSAIRRCTGQATEIQIVADQIAKTKKKLNEILSANTGQPLEIVEKDTDRDNYMTAEEAKAYGLIDGVVIHK